MTSFFGHGLKMLRTTALALPRRFIPTRLR